ncbi:MAG: apolipoprotein N-acyltransferase, partial [Elusimicrobia bacterium]|nr:apolipoprotein N-acyltransferase [Elusimicrobiota bacterium]
PRRPGLAAPSVLAAGAALALTLPRPGWCLLAWLSPAVLMLEAARAAAPRRAAALGFLFGFAFAGVVMHWIYQTCRFAQVPVPAALLAWGALSAFLALQWALFAAAGRALAEDLPAAARPWAWATLWVGLEWASLRWTPRLGFDLLAYTQWRHLALVQVGALAGPHALGFVLVAWNAALAGLVLRRSRESAGPLLMTAGLAGLCLAYGLLSLSERPPRPAPGPTAVILQPDVDQYHKWDAAFAGGIRAGFERLLAAPLPPRSLVVWPESALPGWLDDPAVSGWAASLARRAGAPMLVGAVVAVGGKRHNAAALFGADGTVEGLYAKRRLVPFGEFVPLRRWLQPYIGILATLGDFDPGPRRQPLFETPLGRLGATICYEAVFPSLTRGDAARGARVIANLTNDGWYKDTWGPYQHFQANVFRAVETRTTVVRAANTGISGVIDPWGVVLASAPVMTTARLDVPLPARDPFPEGSLYDRTGDVLGAACLLASAALAARGLRRRA